MKAMVIEKISDLRKETSPLTAVEMADPEPGPGQVLIKVSACGVCHTEIDEIEGRAEPAFLPLVPGHQVVGRVIGLGPGTKRYNPGDRVGVGWRYSSCGRCDYCQGGRDNLCAQYRATGKDAHGGYAQYMVAPEDSVHPIDESIADEHAAPLLCAGAIGYRSLRLAELPEGGRLGLTGFGASAHLVLMMIRAEHPDAQVYVFARNEKERAFSLSLGAVWAGNTTEVPPELLDSVIDTTPVWLPVVSALRLLKPGGRLVINAIRKEEGDKERLLDIHYPSHLWLEKEIKSVANVARRDIEEFLAIAARLDIRPEVTTYPLAEANEALIAVKTGKIRGAKVLVMD